MRADSAAAQAGQRGMAVIAALLIVAAVTTIAAALMQRQSAYLRAVQSDQTRAALQAALQGGLMTAQRRLREDGTREARTRPGGWWAEPIIDTRLAQVRRGEPPGPVFTGKLEDEQGKFNLRNLVSQGSLSMDSVEQLRTLCNLVGVPPDVADRIAQRVLVSLPGAAGNGAGGPAQDGAEGAPGQPAAATAFNGKWALAPVPRGIDDLRNLPGVDESVIARLRPHLTLLPSVTLVNVNTATPEVLATAVPGISLDRAKALVAQRDGGQWFLNGRDFVNRLNIPDLPPNSVRVAVQSNWFQFVGAARLDQAIMLAHALLARDGQTIYTIWSREGA